MFGQRLSSVELGAPPVAKDESRSTSAATLRDAIRIGQRDEHAERLERCGRAQADSELPGQPLGVGAGAADRLPIDMGA
jgi:hypothetical protein